MDNKHKRVYKTVQIFDAFLYVTFEEKHGIISLDFFSFTTKTISKKEIAAHSKPTAELIDRSVQLIQEYLKSSISALGTLQNELTTVGKALIKQYEKIAPEFLVKTWSQLLNIKMGQVASYLDVAVMLKRPSAVRSVGRALARNPLSIIVPCHRVIPKKSMDRLTADPSQPLSFEEVGQYGGGKAVKYNLIKHEGTNNQKN